MFNQWLNGWTASDKIAALAALAGLLQVVALIITFLLMGRTAKRQLRAYVCVSGGSITLRQANQQTFLEGFVALKNFGATPAYNHSCWVRIDLRHPNDPPFDLGAKGLTQAIIAPGSEISLPVHHGPISGQDLTDIQNEAKRIFIWGGANYKDAFRGKRFLKFYCWNDKDWSGKSRWGLLPANKPDEAN